MMEEEQILELVQDGYISSALVEGGTVTNNLWCHDVSTKKDSRYELDGQESMYWRNAKNWNEGGYCCKLNTGGVYNRTFDTNIGGFKPNTEYTVIVYCLENESSTGNQKPLVIGCNLNDNPKTSIHYKRSVFNGDLGSKLAFDHLETGIKIAKIYTKNDLTNCNYSISEEMSYLVEYNKKVKYKVVILEGDWSNYNFTSDIVALYQDGLNSTQTIFNNNGVITNIYEPIIQGITTVLDGQLVSLEGGEGLPSLCSVGSVCDELNLANNTLIKRTHKITLTGNEKFEYYTTSSISNGYSILNGEKLAKESPNILSNIIEYRRNEDLLDEENLLIFRVGEEWRPTSTPKPCGVVIRVRKGFDALAYFKEQYDKGTPIEIIYELKEYEEIQLTEEQVQTYLHHRKLIELHKVSDVADRLEINKDGTAKWTKETKKLILTGIENWEKEIAGVTMEKTSVFKLFTEDKQYGLTNLLCDKLPVSTNIIKNDEVGIGSYHNSTYGERPIIIRLEKSVVGTLEEFKTWLSQNPITVIYEVLNAVTTLIPAEQVNKIPTYQGDNKLVVGGNVKPSRFEVGYKERFENNFVKSMSIKGQTVKNLLQNFTKTTPSDDTINGQYRTPMNVPPLSTITIIAKIRNIDTTNGTVLSPAFLTKIDDDSRVVYFDYGKDITPKIKNGIFINTIKFTENDKYFNSSTRIYKPPVSTANCTIEWLVVLEGTHASVNDYMSFGLNSTEAIITNNGNSYPIFEPTVQGKTKILNGKLVSLEPSDPSLPVLGSVPSTTDILNLTNGTITHNVFKATLFSDIQKYTAYDTDTQFGVKFKMTNAPLGVWNSEGLCNKGTFQYYRYGSDTLKGNAQIRIAVQIEENSYSYARIDKSLLGNGTLTEIESLFNGLELQFALQTPIGTQLTEEQLKAYDTHKKLISLSKVEGVADSFELKEDGSGVLNKSTAYITFDDGNGWRKLDGNRWTFDMPDAKRCAVYEINIVCDKVNVITYGQEFKGEKGIALYTNETYGLIWRADATTKNDFDAMISELKPTIYYQLTTPTTTHIPKSLIAPILTQQTNNLSIGGAVKPSSYSITLPTHREPIKVNFRTPDIQDNISVKVVASNEQGDNEMGEPVNIYVSPQPRWTYLVEEGNVLLDWKDKFDFETGYKIEYRTNGVEYHYDYIDSSNVELGGNVQYMFPLSPYDYATVRICCVSNQDHFYSKPIRTSKGEDTSILAPPNFAYEWSGEGGITFSWTDNYTLENSFEFTYAIDNGIWKTEVVQSDSKETTGKTYSITKQLQPFQAIQAKVRMVWDLNKSAYSTQSTAYIPIDPTPVKGIKKERSSIGVLVDWEPQNAIEKYQVHCIVGDEERIIETKYNHCEIEIDYSVYKQVEIYIISYFVGGSVSSKSDSIIFSPYELEALVETFKYQSTKELYHINSSYMQLALRELYFLHDCSINDFKAPFELETKYLDKFQLLYSSVGTEIWQQQTRLPYDVSQYISTVKLLQDKQAVQTICVTPTELHALNQNIIMTLIRDRYPITMEINKPRIATLGDSITAGHPNFWAESGTGNPQSQYQYWLSNRLRGGFEVINKGYGRDTSQLLLARFRRDLEPLNAQFCIIQIGTNDLFEAQKAGKDDQKVLDTYTANMRANTKEMVNICLELGVVPIVGNLIPRTGFKGMYREALWAHNDWIKEFCNTTKGVHFVDFYNAGKQNIPPTPLEDPNDIGSMNPKYDGDTIYDEYGNVVVIGNGIHPNVEG